VREGGTINPEYPHALPLVYGLTSKDEAERLVTIFGTLIYEGGLSGRHVYTGPVSEDGKRWHEVDQMTQVMDGMDYIRKLIGDLSHHGV